MGFRTSVYRGINRQPRVLRQSALACLDALILPASLFAAFALRYGTFSPPVEPFALVFLLLPVICLPAFFFNGLYRGLVRYLGSSAVVVVARSALIATGLLIALSLMLDLRGLPRSVVVNFLLLSFFGLGVPRYLARSFLLYMGQRNKNKRPIAIYGAGSAGAQLAIALLHGSDYEPVAFIDDNPALYGSSIRGLRVIPRAEIAHLIKRRKIQEIFLAIPSLSKAARQQLLLELSDFPVRVRSLPPLASLVNQEIGEGQLEPVRIEDLLAREPVAPMPQLLASAIKGKSVMVTGAGGSIGSELVRQILLLEPKRVVGLDISEEAIWRLSGETEDASAEIELVVCSVLDRKKLVQLMKRHDIDVVYHAAAYKHLPLLEQNPLEAVRTNFFGTVATAQSALESKVSSFVLISTDKAVAPTSVLGASKQLAERYIAHLKNEDQVTRFLTVRFGNVLGSSGSVIPTFDRQIRRGGPITLTDPNVTRYFMTIEEACQLVIQGSALGQSGDILVLDMGPPVRIMDLARKMIHLMGKEVGDEEIADQDTVSIRVIGLRPGEKMHEQLFETTEVRGTQHPRIQTSLHTYEPDALSAGTIDRLRRLLEECDEAGAISLMWTICGRDPVDRSGKVISLSPP